MEVQIDSKNMMEFMMESGFEDDPFLNQTLERISKDVEGKTEKSSKKFKAIVDFKS